VEIEFQSAVADYVRTREWHPSQDVQDGESGKVVVTLDVCIDRALTSWILSFGPLARVVGPQQLARDIAEQIERASAVYQSLR
jgi:predicted DNA-binding transcriptional regulator YafY